MDREEQDMRPVPHAREGGEVGVLMGGVDDVLVDLVGDDVGVVLGGHLGDGQQLLPVNTRPQGLEGLHSTRALGRCRKAASSSSTSKVKAGGWRGT